AVLPLRARDMLRAIEAEAYAPGGQALFAAPAVHLLGGRYRLPQLGVGTLQQRRTEGRHSVEQIAVFQRIDQVDQRFEVLEVRHLYRPGQKGFGAREQPDAHLGDDAEVRLAEQPVEARTDSHAILLPGFRARQGAHPSAEEFAVGQDDFEPTDGLPVPAIARNGIAAAGIERISQRAAPAGRGYVDPQLRSGFLQMTIEVEVRHAGLDETGTVRFAHFEHAVQALEVHHHATRQDRSEEHTSELQSRENLVCR